MARDINKIPADESVPPELQCFIGSAGPYIKKDKAEFHHASREAQEWFLRLDPEDVGKIVYAAKLGFWVQTGLRWARWAFWAFTSGLAGALLIGERLQKLGGMISDALSVVRGLL